MSESILSEIRRLGTMSVGELHARYAEAFGEAPRSRNKDYLRKRIAWRIQELAEGTLSERIKERARALARDADLRIVPPRASNLAPTEAVRGQDPRDRRIPGVGAVLSRTFRGVSHSVTVLDDGFEYQGRYFRSLSAVARAITGTRWNGVAFFGLATRGEAA